MIFLSNQQQMMELHVSKILLMIALFRKLMLILIEIFDSLAIFFENKNDAEQIPFVSL